MKPKIPLRRCAQTRLCCLLLAGLIITSPATAADPQRLAVEQRYAVAPPPAPVMTPVDAPQSISAVQPNSVKAPPLQAPDDATQAAPARPAAPAKARITQLIEAPQAAGQVQPLRAYQQEPQPPSEPGLEYVEVISKALSVAPQFKFSQLDIELAKLNEKDTWYRLFPKLNLSTSYDKPINKYINGVETKSYLNISFSTNQYDPISAYIGHDASKVAITMAEMMHLLTIQKFMEQVGQAYVMLNSYEQQTACMADIVRLSQDLVNNIAQRKQNGSLSSLDLRLAELKHDMARQDMEHSVRQRTQELIKLKRSVGLDPLQRSTLDLKSSLPQILGTGQFYVQPDFSQVEQDNLEIRIIRLKEKLQVYNVRLAQAEYMPKFSIGLRTPDPTATKDSAAPYYVTFGGSMPLWSWGEIERGVDRAEAKGKQVQAANALQLQEMRNVWETAGSVIEQLRDRISLAATLVELRELEAKRKTIIHRTGFVEFEAMNEAQIEAVRAKLTLVKAQEEYALARLKLRAQSGELFKENIRISHEPAD